MALSLGEPGPPPGGLGAGQQWVIPLKRDRGVRGDELGGQFHLPEELDSLGTRWLSASQNQRGQH